MVANTTPPIDIRITYDPAQTSASRWPAYNQLTSLVRNTVYSRLEEKAANLKQANYEGHRAIYLALAFSINAISLTSTSRKRENGNKQIDLSQRSSTLSLSAQKELDLDSAPTIGNGEHVVTPPVFALIGGFNFSENMRRKAG